MKIRPTQEDLLAAVNTSVPDVIAPHLKVLFCGINPGVYSAVLGCHFARPGNRFWKALYLAGFTRRLFVPQEQDRLLELGYGITNLVNRATISAAELSAEEFILGGEKLREQVRAYAPEWVALLGIEAYRKAFRQPKARLGFQAETIEKTRLWVLPNPSGLNAHYTQHQLGDLFRELHETVEGREGSDSPCCWLNSSP
jgi:TDG/mug DNA glycosylase family protein